MDKGQGKDLTMLILSCDSYADLWDGQVKLLEENWGERGIRTCIVSEGECGKQYPRVEVIQAGKGTEWSDRLGYALEQVETEYVFLTLDDYYLIRKAKDRRMTELLDLMDKEQIDYIRFFPRPKRATREAMDGCQGLYRVDTGCTYSVNLYPGLWRKRFLQSTVRKGMSAWKAEVLMHKRAEEYGAKCAVSHGKEYPILDVVRKGRLLRKAAAYFRRHPGIYNGTRETNTRGFETRLAIQTMCARHLPGPLRTAAKQYMIRRGHHYYSDEAEQEADKH